MDEDFIWTTNPKLAIRLEKAQKAREVVKEYGGTVDIYWPTYTMNLNLPDSVSIDDQLECAHRKESLMLE